MMIDGMIPFRMRIPPYAMNDDRHYRIFAARYNSFLRCWCWLIFIFFVPFLVRFRIRTSLVFILSFVSTMLSARFRFLLRSVEHMTYILICTYVRCSHFFILVWGIRFVWVIVCTIFSFLFIFPPETISRCRVIGACPVTTDYIVAMS